MHKLADPSPIVFAASLRGVESTPEPIPRPACSKTRKRRYRNSYCAKAPQSVSVRRTTKAHYVGHTYTPDIRHCLDASLFRSPSAPSSNRSHRMSCCLVGAQICPWSHGGRAIASVPLATFSRLGPTTVFLGSFFRPVLIATIASHK